MFRRSVPNFSWLSSLTHCFASDSESPAKGGVELHFMKLLHPRVDTYCGQFNRIASVL
jgi:hypothetical protein